LIPKITENCRKLYKDYASLYERRSISQQAELKIVALSNVYICQIILSAFGFIDYLVGRRAALLIDD
jgi:hypothetical protein